MKKYLTLLCLLVSSCYAVEWIEIMPKWYIDKESYFYNDETFTATAWLKILNNGQFKDIKGQKIWYSLTKEEALCGERKTRMLKSYAYNLKSQVIVKIDTPEREYREIIPSTMTELIYKILCQEHFEKDYD